MLVPRAGSHSIWLFWDDAGACRTWYVNLEQRHRWHASGCDTRDELLDIVCERPREWRWKDEDELEAALAFGVLDRERAVAVRAEGERVARVIERWDSPFSDGWDDWRRSELASAAPAAQMGRAVTGGVVTRVEPR